MPLPLGPMMTSTSPWPTRQVDPVEDEVVAEALAHALELDHRRVRCVVLLDRCVCDAHSQWDQRELRRSGQASERLACNNLQLAHALSLRSNFGACNNLQLALLTRSGDPVPSAGQRRAKGEDVMKVACRTSLRLCVPVRA